MTVPDEYAQLLRAIGQALEVLRFGSFTMELSGEDFLVRGSAVTSTEQEEAREIRERIIKFVWEALPGEKATQAEIESAMSIWPAQLVLRYTPKDMDRLEQEGKAKRQSAAGVPDVASLSQLLRTIGAYVKKKRARLVKIARSGDSLAIRYDTAEGERREENVSAGSLYEFWAQLYLRRSHAGKKLES
ncbi:MAG TPA: hypothetical protein VEG60_00990 [Candidatus Binatia bacterium]|nr:hypothetical protein [Candidatus Binatia bacterium]